MKKGETMKHLVKTERMASWPWVGQDFEKKQDTKAAILRKTLKM